MATEAEHLCPKCKQEQWYPLFEALSAKASDGLRCSACHHGLNGKSGRKAGEQK
jgi:DNA-directed RNA polymerase subunit RPC12/RpoP